MQSPLSRSPSTTKMISVGIYLRRILRSRQIINTANIVGGQHLSDGLARIKFMDDIRQFVMQQFSATRAARSDEECMECLKNIRAENESLLEQSRMLRSRTAQLFAQIN
ncbi:hypothetical protein DJ547_22150 [Enterobacter hormaechei]|nr:hypothetical protein DJ546_18995 [Enterobacter hormaechei]TYF49098.1 hypothetical protein DJ547_22150 [Enterobacter hormaechei]